MKKMTIMDRVLLLFTGLLAAYQVVEGVEGNCVLSIVSYTVGFGALLVAGLLMIILGFEVLESPWIAVISTIIPISISLGLVCQYLEAWRFPYFLFTLFGFIIVAYTQLKKKEKAAIVLLVLVHGISGLVIFIVPILASLMGWANPGFWFVGLGGALIGVGGVLLSFAKVGKPILSIERILQILPTLLFLMTTSFIVGFALA